MGIMSGAEVLDRSFDILCRYIGSYIIFNIIYLVLAGIISLIIGGIGFF